MPLYASRRDVLEATGALAATGGLMGCTGVIGDDDRVAVSSKRFTEQEILGYLAFEALDATDIAVLDEIGLGGTAQNFEALREGQVDLYWEYTGTAWLILPPEREEIIPDEDELLEAVREEFETEHGLTFLEPAPFSNGYVLTANPYWVEETGIEAISQFAEHINDGNTDIDMVMNAEFAERPDGWPGLIEHYDMAEAAGELSIQTVDDEIVYQVVGEGEADIGMGFDTDPRIVIFGLYLLEDDEEFFLSYNPAPLVSTDTLDQYPEMADVLNQIGPTFDTDLIRALNHEVAEEGRRAQEVAIEHLESEGIL
jgi:glycine betaine/choline ABC-type transport system substrate-binding protein